jgi:hypothetical protein
MNPPLRLEESQSFNRHTLEYIHHAAEHGLYEIRGLGAKRALPTFDDLLFLTASASRYPLEDPARHELGGGVLALEVGVLVQVAVVEFGEDRAQGAARQPDVHHQVVGVEPGSAKLQVHHVGSPMEPLGRSEDGAAEAVGDHHVVADAQAVHGRGSLVVTDAVHQGVAGVAGQAGLDRRQVVEGVLAGDQPIQGRVRQQGQG